MTSGVNSPHIINSNANGGTFHILLFALLTNWKSARDTLPFLTASYKEVRDLDQTLLGMERAARYDAHIDERPVL